MVNKSLNLKKKLVKFLMAVTTMVMLVGCSSDEDTVGTSATAEPVETVYHHVEITVKDYGTIKVELNETVAPITVANFIKLAEEGFYDGLTFHRIMNGFMIQGGDPKGNGTGGSDEKIKGEFSANGVENNLSHTRGAISMARARSMDSASSQFFIMHEDAPHLDGDYAAFGWVTSGIEVVDAICETTQVEDMNGTVLARNQPVITDVRVLGEIIDATHTSGDNESTDTPVTNPVPDLLTRESENLLSGKHNVEIEIENYGTIALTLDADIAPVTVTNFIDLVKEGFYNGLTFHRIIDGFMIQGGDPLGIGIGGSDRNIQGEFAQNGIENNLAHTRGVISMARSYLPDSASSQFFIMHQDAPHLDGAYAAFGQVTSGIEVVDAICEATQVEDANGTVSAENQPKIKEIRIVE